MKVALKAETSQESGRAHHDPPSLEEAPH